MKNSTLIKWAAGLSGAVLFTGFVGYISHDDEDVAQASAQNENTASASGSSDTYTSDDGVSRDDVFSQWGGRRSFDNDADRDGDRGGLPSGSSDDSTSSQGSSGRLHTRGS